MTPLSFDEPEDNFRLLRAWRDADSEWFPERLDSQEPIRERIDPTRIEDSAAARSRIAWYATRREPPILAIRQHGVRNHGSMKLYVYAKNDRPAAAHRAAGIVAAWSSVAPPEYGMVHVLTEVERLEAMAPWRSDMSGDENGGQVSWGFTVQLKRGLPILYWRNLFGRPYLDLFGRKALMSAPAFSVEQHEWGIAIQLTDVAPTEVSYP